MKLTEKFQKLAKRQMHIFAADAKGAMTMAFAEAQMRGRPGQPVAQGSPLDKLMKKREQRAKRLEAEKKLKQLATTNLEQDKGTIAQKKDEIRDLYAEADGGLAKGSKTEVRLEKAARRAHTITAEIKLGRFTPAGENTTGTAQFHEAEVREHYAASGAVVARGSKLDERIEAAVRRSASLAPQQPKC